MVPPLNFLLDQIWLKLGVGQRLVEIVNFILHRFLHLFLINVNNPESCAVTESTISALKDFRLINFADSCVVELSPLVVKVVLYEVKVMTTIRATFVHTDCVKVICALGVVLLNMLEHVSNILLSLFDFKLNLLLL